MGFIARAARVSVGVLVVLAEDSAAHNVAILIWWAEAKAEAKGLNSGEKRTRSKLKCCRRSPRSRERGKCQNKGAAMENYDKKCWWPKIAPKEKKSVSRKI